MDGRVMKTILHLDMDAFFVSVECLLNPRLKGRPVAVGGSGNRGVVSSASYEARRYGVRSAMPTARARHLCPELIVVSGRHGRYGEYSRRVRSILERYSPYVQMVSIDEGYVDLTGTERLFGPPFQVGTKILKEIRDETGLPASGGIAGNRTTAKIASETAKPSGLIYVLPGKEGAFLAPLPVREMPGVGPKAAETLNRLGVKTIGNMAALGESLAVHVLGDYGRSLVRRARGLGGDSFHAHEPCKSISHEVTFPVDVGARSELRSELCRLVEKTAWRLRKKKMRARTVTLKLRTPDFKTYTRSRTLRRPTDLDCVIFPIACEMMDRLLEGRRRVRLIGTALSNLTAEGVQRDLFLEERIEKYERFYQSVDAVRERYGFQAAAAGTATRCSAK